MRRFYPSLLVPTALALCFVPLAAQLDLSGAKPPVAKQVPKKDTLHGETRIDQYFWLREKASPEVIAHLKAENTYTAAVMKPTEPLQETLYAEMLGRIKQTDLSVPYRVDEYWYYTRTEEGKQYPIRCRKRGNLESAEEVMLDLNELAKGEKFLGLGAFAVSDDANLFAYTTDVTGFRQYTLYVKDLRTGKLLPDKIEHVVVVAWAADHRTLFYVTEDDAKRPYRLFRHVLGESKDELVYEEKDELFRLYVRRSRDRAFLFANSESMTTTEVRYLRANKPTGHFHVLLPRENEHEYSVDHRDGLFYIRTNKDAKNFRLVTAPIAEPAKWTELVPHRKDVLLEDFDVFAFHCVLTERAEGLPQLRVIDLRDKKTHRIMTPEPVYHVRLDLNPEFKTMAIRFRYESFVTPESVYDYNMDLRKRRLLKQTEVLGGFDPSKYVSEQIMATASDGAKIPIALVNKKGLDRNGKNPLLLYGYGAYGYSLPVDFDSSRLSLLDRGVIFAQAHIRGGSERGRDWYDTGKMLHKKNSFTDFIAAAEHLIAEKLTARDRLIIEGGSAGGLLIGAVVNMRPDLFKAAVLHVPFVDVINTMLDESLPLTVQEFLEWGNPKNKPEYDYLKSYCPYTNLAAKDYPAILVETSLNDSQVMYWEPAKYVAKLRATKTDKNSLLFKINLDAGHGGASGRYDALKEEAFAFAFMLNQWGISK